MRPRLLDLFCGAGGAAMGYHRAGFDVVGVDIHPQPRYPFPFIQADAMLLLDDLLNGWPTSGFAAGYILDDFAAIHASPPCRDHSTLAYIRGVAGTGFMLGAVRERLAASGLPYAIENVESARMPGSIVLCGTEFGLTVVDQDGQTRWLKRHRRFESNVLLMGAGGCNCRGRRIGGVYGGGGGAPRTQVSKGGRRRGGYQLGAAQARTILGVPWMNRYEAAQAIPPAYTEHIGGFLLYTIEGGTTMTDNPGTPAVPATDPRDGQPTADTRTDLAAVDEGGEPAEGWPDSYVPDSPHVQETRRLRAGIEAHADELHVLLEGTERPRDPIAAAMWSAVTDWHTEMRALLGEPTTRADITTPDETGAHMRAQEADRG